MPRGFLAFARIMDSPPSDIGEARSVSTKHLSVRTARNRPQKNENLPSCLASEHGQTKLPSRRLKSPRGSDWSGDIGEEASHRDARCTILMLGSAILQMAYIVHL